MTPKLELDLYFIMLCHKEIVAYIQKLLIGTHKLTISLNLKGHNSVKILRISQFIQLGLY